MSILAKLTFSAGLLALLTAVAGARPAGQGLKPEDISPYFIEWFIDISEDADLKSIWQSLNIPVPTDMNYRCGGNCTAETFEIETADEGQARTVALKISFETGEFYQYLVFRRSAGGEKRWRLLGYIDARGQRYGPPAHRIESGEGRAWLVIRSLWGRGSGMLARGEAWYEIKEAGLKQVLSYPVEGHHSPCRNSLGRSYKSLLARHGSVNGVYTVPVQFLVAYNISDCDKGAYPPSLFAKGQKANYVWDGEKERFILDTSRSDVTEQELKTVYNFGAFSYEEFVESNFNEIMDIASNGGVEQKAWLKGFLTGIKDGPRKAALQQALLQ